MLKIRIIGILFGVLACLLFMASCQRQADGKLAEVRSRLFENPDSAGLVLNDLLPDYDYMSEADKALFDLCRFQVASFYPESFPPLENINSAISYFKKTRDKKHLIEAYYAKSLYYKAIKDFEQANVFLLKSRDLADKISYRDFSGRIYFDLGYIAYRQDKYDSGLEYLNHAIKLFQEDGDTRKEAIAYDIYSMAALALDDMERAREYALKGLNITTDSLSIGDLLTTIGTSYYFQEQFDSAQYYFRESLQYPAYSTNKSFRYYKLANLFSNIEKYDSAQYYITRAFEYPMDIYIKEESYRILTDLALHRNDKEKVAEYIELRAQCNDSIKSIEYQPDITVVTRLHQSDLTAQQQRSKQRYLFIGIIVLVGVVLFLLLLSRKKKREKKAIIESLEQQHREALEENEAVLNTLSVNNQKEQERKINVFKAELHSYISSYLNEKSKNRSFTEKEQQRKNVYIEFLNIDKEELFIANMNYLLASFPDKLKQRFRSISHKELVWCCLFVLDVPASDVALVFNYTQTSQYKFKQRLIKKLQFPNTKEFELYLSNLLYTDA